MIRKLYFAAFNLIEGIDVQAIEAKIARYQEENAEQIMINRARKVPAVFLLMYKLLISYPLAPNWEFWRLNTIFIFASDITAP